jgi:flavin-dependent dehydrogenase
MTECGSPREAASDVFIVGAGPAGAALALALRGAGVERVVLLDRPSGGGFRIGESAPPGIAPLLRRLGLPDDLARVGHHPYHGNRSLWADAAVIDDFLHRGLGHGWHLDRAAFDGWLREQAVARGVTLVSPARLEMVASRRTGGWRLRLTHAGRTIDHVTRVVVDASGRRAAVAMRLGVSKRRLDAMVALAILVPVRQPGLGALSLVESAADGWWYAAPVPSGAAIVYLMTDHDIARAGKLRQPGAFQRAWAGTRQLADLLSLPAHQPDRIALFPAHTQFIDRAAGRGWLAIGDALLALDPLTSSGITGALGDACSAAETICAWLGGRRESDWAAAAENHAARARQTLRRYLVERQRRYAAAHQWSDRPFWRRRVAPQ